MFLGRKILIKKKNEVEGVQFQVHIPLTMSRAAPSPPPTWGLVSPGVWTQSLTLAGSLLLPFMSAVRLFLVQPETPRAPE